MKDYLYVRQYTSSLESRFVHKSNPLLIRNWNLICSLQLTSIAPHWEFTIQKLSNSCRIAEMPHPVKESREADGLYAYVATYLMPISSMWPEIMGEFPLSSPTLGLKNIWYMNGGERRRGYISVMGSTRTLLWVSWHFTWWSEASSGLGDYHSWYILLHLALHKKKAGEQNNEAIIDYLTETNASRNK